MYEEAEYLNKEIFKNGEADNWFSRNITYVENENNIMHRYPLDCLVEWLTPFKTEIRNILEIGCGSGHALNYLCKKLEAKGIGIDPSEKAIAYANGAFSKELSFIVGTSDNIKIPENSFEVIHLGFFLYLVDREDYYKTIAEVDRLVKPGGFVSIIDFDPLCNNKREYHHKEGVFSFKNRNSLIFTSTGHYSVVSKISISHQTPHFSKDPRERCELCLLYKETDAYLTFPSQPSK